MEAQAVLMLAKVTVFFFLIYVLFPAHLVRFPEEARGGLDRLFITLTVSTFSMIMVVYLLAALKLYETFSLLFVLLALPAAPALVRRRRPSYGSLEAMGMPVLVELLTLSESHDRWARARQLVGRVVARLGGSLIQALRQAVLSEPLAGIAPAAVFVLAAALRFPHALTRAGYAASDPYVHLSWMKSLGNCEFFPDGVYPFGYHAVLSALAKLTLIDPYWIVRFVGPLTGSLLVLSTYYLALRVSRSPAASLLGLAIYTVLPAAGFPDLLFRQMASLTQEFAALFTLPGLLFLLMYLKSPDRTWLWFYFQTVAVAFLVHLYAGVYLLLWAAVLTSVALVVKTADGRRVAAVVGVSLAGVALGLVPLGAGLLAGKEFHASSIQMIERDLRWNPAVPGLSRAAWALIDAGNPFLDPVWPVTAVLVIGGLARREPERRLVLWGTGAATGLTFLLYRAAEFGLPQVMDPARTAVFLTLLLPAFYAAAFEVVLGFFSGVASGRVAEVARKGTAAALSLLLLCLYLPAGPDPAVLAEQLEYDAAARAYLTIKEQFSPREWTLVAPTEQLAQVRDYGWHYELLRFVREFDLEQAEDPEFKLPIPTPHIFVFTEKRPLGLGREVRPEDAERDLAVQRPGDDPFVIYYGTPDQRAILEARAINLMEAYRKNHEGVSIFYEDENLRIYHIRHQVQPQA